MMNSPSDRWSSGHVAITFVHRNRTVAVRLTCCRRHLATIDDACHRVGWKLGSAFPRVSRKKHCMDGRSTPKLPAEKASAKDRSQRDARYGRSKKASESSRESITLRQALSGKFARVRRLRLAGRAALLAKSSNRCSRRLPRFSRRSGESFRRPSSSIRP